MLMTQNCWVAASSRSPSRIRPRSDRMSSDVYPLAWRVHEEEFDGTISLYSSAEVHAIFINASHEMDGRRAPPRTAMMAGKRICPQEERSVFDNVQVHGNLQLISRCRCVIESLKFRSKIIQVHCGLFRLGFDKNLR